MASTRKWIVALVLLVMACGKRGDPHPPVPIIPRATSDLVVTQRGSKVILAWSYPSLTTAGRALGTVRRVVVYRYEEPLPAATAAPDAKSVQPGEVEVATAGPVEAFSKIPTIGVAPFNRLKQRIDTLEGPQLPAASVGAKLVYEDGPALRTADNRPVRFTYAVVTEGATASSEPSNLASIVPVDVPTPPTGLTAAASATGIALKWDPPQKSITGADKPPIVGYNIYRVKTGDAPDELAVAVNPAPVKDPNFTDVPAYGAYDYRVTAISSLTEPRLESEPSTPASAKFTDLTPPPPPASLTALVETNVVRLVWDPVDAPDLQGYLVYRREGPHRLQLTPGPAKQTNFRDISVERGVTYVYEVTSVDKSRNESKPVQAAPVLVPK